MPRLRSHLRRRYATWAFVLVCGVAVAAWWRQPGERAPDNSMVFSMSLRDASGDVLASPVVMGQPGQKVKVRLAGQEDPAQEKMQLTLDPIGMEGGQMLYSFDLSAPGQMEPQHGTVKLAMGREKRIRIHGGGFRGVTLSLYTESLKQYVQRHESLKNGKRAGLGRVES